MLVQPLDRFKIGYLSISTSLLDLSPLHVYHCTLLLIPLQTGAFHSILCDCHDSFQLVVVIIIIIIIIVVVVIIIIIIKTITKFSNLIGYQLP